MESVCCGETKGEGERQRRQLMKIRIRENDRDPCHPRQGEGMRELTEHVRGEGIGKTAKVLPVRRDFQ